MSNDEDAFHRAIAANPDDLSARRIYADWLEEHGKTASQLERGEFIRTQIALSQESPKDNRKKELQAREKALLKKHRAEWVPDALKLPSNLWNSAQFQFRNGMLEGVTFKAGEGLSEEVAEALATIPLKQVTLVDLNRSLAVEYVSKPWFDRVQELEIADAANLSGAISEIVNHKYARHLRRIDLQCPSFFPTEESRLLLDVLRTARTLSRVKEIEFLTEKDKDGRWRQGRNDRLWGNAFWERIENHLLRMGVEGEDQLPLEFRGEMLDHGEVMRLPALERVNGVVMPLNIQGVFGRRIRNNAGRGK